MKKTYPRGTSHIYWTSSATAYSPSFGELAEAFEEDGENLDASKTKEQLVGEYLTEKWLKSYVEWGYLESNGGMYSLTDMGKEAYYKNRLHTKKIVESAKHYKW